MSKLEIDMQTVYSHPGPPTYVY